MRDMEPLLGFDETQKAQALRRYEADNARDLARSRSAEQARLGLLDLDIALAENDAATSGDGGSLRRLAGEFDSLGRMESATELQNLADFYERNAASIRESRTMPFSELERKVEELRKAARPSPVAGETENPGETALHEETRLREKILMERRQALLTDPAAAVAEEVNAAGSSLFDPGVQNRGIEGEAMPLWKLAELRLALQAASSVPPGRRRVLTNEESTAYRSLWQQADAEARMRLAGTILSYGKQSDKVAVESGLSPSERLALMRSRSDPAAASALARIFSVRVSASIPESGAYSREANVRTAAVEHSEVVRGLRAATSLFPDHAGLKSLLEDCEYTLEGLSRMRAGPPSATASLLDGTLKSLTHGRFALFYDSSLWPDPEELKSRLTRVVMDKLRAGIEPEDDAASPGQSGQFDQFVGRLELLQSSGVWLNGPDGQGYALFDPLTGQTVLDFENNPLLLDDVQLLSGQV